MSTTPGPTADVAALLNGLPDRERRVALALRDAVLEAVPDARESIKWGQPNYGLNSILCAISPADGYVRLQLWRGADLPDPTGLLEGTGKQLRHVKVRTLEQARAGALRELLREAVAIDGA